MAGWTFDNLHVRKPPVHFAPRSDTQHNGVQELFAILIPLFVKHNFLRCWCGEVIAVDALIWNGIALDEAWQFVYAAIFRVPIQLGIIDVLLACTVMGHRSKIDAPIRGIARVSRRFIHIGNLC